jgi:hypothetical protein
MTIQESPIRKKVFSDHPPTNLNMLTFFSKNAKGSTCPVQILCPTLGSDSKKQLLILTVLLILETQDINSALLSPFFLFYHIEGQSMHKRKTKPDRKPFLFHQYRSTV